MTDEFLALVQRIIEPRLVQLGFQLDEVRDVVEQGRKASMVFFRSHDCKIQIYYSSREGEINAMIGPLDAPNQHGQYDRSGKWHYFNDFANQPKSSLEELVRQRRDECANFETTAKWLEWIKRERIDRYFDSAHAAIVGER
ncbi:hypothetical protein [Mycobacterium triplex]|nr:hypothetical protein [Mycobacterium triplex]